MADKSDNHEYGTLGYFAARVPELETERNAARAAEAYYRKELAKAHGLLGRVTHQLSERWDNVRLTEYFPTDNLQGNRTLNNPEGKK